MLQSIDCMLMLPYVTVARSFCDWQSWKLQGQGLAHIQEPHLCDAMLGADLLPELIADCHF